MKKICCLIGVLLTLAGCGSRVDSLQRNPGQDTIAGLWETSCKNDQVTTLQVESSENSTDTFAFELTTQTFASGSSCLDEITGESQHIGTFKVTGSTDLDVNSAQDIPLFQVSENQTTYTSYILSGNSLTLFFAENFGLVQEERISSVLSAPTMTTLSLKRKVLQ